MSYELVEWAYQQNIKPGSLKFVLVTMAQLSKPFFFASMNTLAERTGQDIKTVRKNVHKLVEMDYLEEQEKRRGKTGQIIEYHFKYQGLTDLSTDLSTRTTKNGGLEGGKSGSKTTVFPLKDSQKRMLKTPKNGSQKYKGEHLEERCAPSAQDDALHQGKKSPGNSGFKSVQDILKPKMVNLG